LARRGMPRLHEAIGGKTPLVLTHHHFEPGESLGSYDCVVFVSHTQRDRVLHKAGLAQGKTRIVHNPVADEFRSVHILPEEQRQGIVYSGALIPRKGVGVLLEAAAMHPGLRRQPLLLCGEGQLDAERAHFVEQQQLDVRLMGRLARHELSEVLAGAKLMVLPSRMEGWSASINESLCCGTPVVGYAPQVTELREVLDMEVGLPFEANTQSAADLGRLMVEALDNSLQRTAQRTSLATAARAYLSGERFVREYERVYAEMVD
jgi:glycosyltransferase involved in cell wall biosynthesis